MIADKLPTVLTFPGTKQNSISVLRALKHIRDMLNEMDNQIAFIDDVQADRFRAAMDDLELLINAVKD